MISRMQRLANTCEEPLSHTRQRDIHNSAVDGSQHKAVQPDQALLKMRTQLMMGVVELLSLR